MKTETKKMKCYNCGYDWDYKGSSAYYVTCPRCMIKVSINKAERIKGVDEE